MSSVFKIGIIGNGNAGNYFAQHFKNLGMDVLQYSKKPNDGLLAIDNYSPNQKLDILFLAVPDSQIKNLSISLPEGSTVIVHLSGTTMISEIDDKHPNRAVFWPLMSLSSFTKANINEIPFCLEASNDLSKKILKEWSEDLGLRTEWCNYEQRLSLHLAAVMSQNFSNHLFHLTYEILAKENLDFELFKPILLETVKQLGTRDPQSYQTGPAIRKDEATIHRHLELLNGSAKEIYKIISRSIQEENERKL